jgi:hypothetical protein
MSKNEKPSEVYYNSDKSDSVSVPEESVVWS